MGPGGRVEFSHETFTGPRRFSETSAGFGTYYAETSDTQALNRTDTRLSYIDRESGRVASLTYTGGNPFQTIGHWLHNLPNQRMDYERGVGFDLGFRYTPNAGGDR
jgi:hypothetical protein